MDLHVYRNSQDRWHDLRTAARERGAVLALNAVTLAELVGRLTPDLKAASPAQRLVCVQRAVQEAGAGAAAGVLRYAYDAIRELKASRVQEAELRGAGASLLARIFSAYSRLMMAAGLTDPEDRRWIAAGRITEGNSWAAQFESVVVHAIYDLNDAEFTLLHNLIELLPGGGTVVLFNTTANVKPTQFAEWTWQRFVHDEAVAHKTFPDFVRSSGPASDLLERLFVFNPAPPLQSSGVLRVFQCPGRYREIETIGSEIAELVAAGMDPNDIAVIVRHIETYGEMIEDVFTRYGIDHVFETGVPLLRIPFIKYWIARLDLVTSDRSRDAMARVLSSAYYDPRLSPDFDIERELAEIGYIDRQHLKASALAARRSSGLTAEFQRFESVLDKLETLSASPLQFVQQLRPGTGLTDRDRQAWRIFYDEIEAVDPLAGRIPFSQFRRMASDIAGLQTIDRFSDRVAAPGLPRVRIIAPHSLGARSYRQIFSPGFADGEIPASSGGNPLLPDVTINALNTIIRPRRILTSRDRNRREPLYLFLTLDSAMERATLTAPTINPEGEPIYPSSYIVELARHFADPPVMRIGRTHTIREPGEFRRRAAADWRDDLLEERHVRSFLDDDVIERIRWERRGFGRADMRERFLSPDRVWSPSELNAIATCPFVFLARHHLKLRPVELPDFEVPPTEVGNLAHRILREFYAMPVPGSEPAAASRMQEIINRQLAPLDVNGQGPNMVIDPSLWNIRRPQLVRTLLEYVKFAVRDARDGYETLPDYLDRSLPQARLGATTLAGRPDHVAVRRTHGMLSGIRIDDFKYSAASSNTSRQLKDSFQIPVYAYLAARALDAESMVPIEGRYLLLRSPSSPVVAHAIDASVIDSIAVRIEALLEKVNKGRLQPDPLDRQECGSCDYRRLCRFYGG